MTRTTAKHSVTYFIESRDDGPRATFRCHGDENSACRWYPNCDHDEVCDCEEVPHKTCNIVEWMDVSDCGTECYDGPKIAITSAAAEIVTNFTGDCLEWSFAPEDK